MAIRLEWTPNVELDMSKYYIYRQVVVTGVIMKIDEVNHPTHEYVDTDGNSDYLYFVSAVDANGNESAKAGPVRLPLSIGICYVYDTFRTADDLPAVGIKIQVKIVNLPLNYSGYFWSGQIVMLITDALGNWALSLPIAAEVHFICVDFGIDVEKTIPDKTSCRFGDIT